MSQQFRLQLDLQWFAGEKTEPATAKEKTRCQKKGSSCEEYGLTCGIYITLFILAFFMFGAFMKE